MIVKHTSHLLKIPQYGFLKRVTATVVTASGGTGHYNIHLGTAEECGGFLQTFNADGNQTSYLGTAGGGIGILGTHNKHGVQVGYFGANKYGDGVAVLNDRYGDAGWSATGKKITLSTMVYGCG